MPRGSHVVLDDGVRLWDDVWKEGGIFVVAVGSWNEMWTVDFKKLVLVEVGFGAFSSLNSIMGLSFLGSKYWACTQAYPVLVTVGPTLPKATSNWLPRFYSVAAVADSLFVSYFVLVFFRTNTLKMKRDKQLCHNSWTFSPFHTWQLRIGLPKCLLWIGMESLRTGQFA